MKPEMEVAAFIPPTPVGASVASVIAFGGSILAPPEPDPEFIATVAAALDDWSMDGRILVVVGGGAPARLAIAAAREMGPPEDALDRIGIQATRLNAQQLLAFLHAMGVPANDDVPLTCDDAANEHGRVVVMGGTTPGHSTDYVAAELARRVGADRLIVATNVDGVYTADPRTNANARRIIQCGYRELGAIVGPAEWKQAGQAGVVDPLAVALLAGAGITTCVVEGHDLENLARALAGDDFHGTRVADGADLMEAP